MRQTTNLFLINGKPFLSPDQNISFSYEDIDSKDTGRTEDGVMHRSVVRFRVGKWGFSYETISEEEKQYMEDLLGETPTFAFTRPSRANSNVMVTTECYASKSSASWFNAKKGIWKNFKFNVIEC